MVFSLEALQAFHGDSLLLHAGTKTAPKLVLIDGGPRGTYDTFLKPRLDELRAERAPDGALTIDLAMVSHIDEDHVFGLIELGADLIDVAKQNQPLPYDVHTLWHNSFDDTLGNAADRVREAAFEVLSRPLDDPKAEEIRLAGLAVVASVPQGRRLRDQAKQLNWRVNAPFQRLVELPASGARRIKVGRDTTLTVLCPHAAQLEKLHEAWDTWLRAHPKAQTHEAAPAAAKPDEDDSPYNLSSIVVLAQARGKRMLLTGDALDTHILAGLDEAGISKGGITKVDILKLPHHGSIRNIKPEFFERVRADHYVISADGLFHNPDTATLDLLTKVRSDDDFAIHLTNRTGELDLDARLTSFLKRKQAAGRRFEVVFRDPKALSLRIDLAD